MGKENRGQIEKCLGGHLNPADQWSLEINSVCSHSRAYFKDIIRLTAGQSCLWLGPVEGADVNKKDRVNPEGWASRDAKGGWKVKLHLTDSARCRQSCQKHRAPGIENLRGEARSLRY